MTFQEGSADPSVILIVASIVGVTTIIVAFLGCMWCRNKWKKLTRRHYQFTDSPQRPPISQVENLTEFTLFPPPSANQFGLPTGISPDEVVFEPLPEIRSRVVATTLENVRPARFTGSCEKISLQDWFDEYQVNFPRDQLQYLREVGPAWYGQAVEGEALGGAGGKRKVVVKILRVDATSTELMQFLQETRVCRDLKHPNLLNLLNRCLEVHPFLLIMEHCDMDLKSYLIEQRKSPEALLRDGILLRMACDITTALQYMHEHGFIHMDVAAHSCLVTSEGVVKLGDYGTAVHLHKSDFYCLGDVAFPIRWCAPETLMCTQSVVEAKDITREANIWSFGVVLWELLEFGKLPYVNVSDNDVIQKVLIDCCLRLEQPKTPCTHKDMIYKIMQLCWLPATMRPSVQKISTLLRYLHDNRDVQSETAAFEARWDSLQPVHRDHNLHRSSPPHSLPLRFDTDFASDECEDLAPRNQGESARTMDDNFSRDNFSSDDFAQGDKSPSSGSMSLGELQADMSPSLLNLRGSVEDLVAGEPMSGDGRGGQEPEHGGLDEGSVKSEGGTRNKQPEDSIESEFGTGNRRQEESELGTRNEDSIKSEGGTLNGRNEDSVKLEHGTLVKSQEDSIASEFETRNRRQEESELGTQNRRYENSVESERGTLVNSQKDSVESERGTLNKGYEDWVESEHGTLNRRSAEDSVMLEHGTLVKGREEPGTFDDRRYEDGESEPPSLETVPASDASDSIQLRISEAIRDLDSFLAEETSSETSDCNTPEKRPVGENARPNGGVVALDLGEPELQKNELCQKSGAVHVSMADD